jgi:nucleoside-diphosphate-sugar epimerase
MAIQTFKNQRSGPTLARSDLKVLVTGASGLIGRNLLAQVNAGVSYHALHGFSKLSLDEINYVLDQAAKVDAVAILHLAWPGSSHTGDYKAAAENIVAMKKTLALAELCKASGLKLLAVGSGADEKPSTENLYISSKNKTKEALKIEIMTGRVVWLRPFNVFDGKSWPRYLSTAGKERIHIIDNRPRDFIHLEDVSTAICCTISWDISGYVDIGTGVARTPSKLIEAAGGVAEVRESFDLSRQEKLPIASPPIKLLQVWQPERTRKFFRSER